MKKKSTKLQKALWKAATKQEPNIFYNEAKKQIYGK